MGMIMNSLFKYFLFLVVLIMPFASFSDEGADRGISVRLNLDDRNYLPGHRFQVFVELKNNLNESKKVELHVETVNSLKEKEWNTVINLELPGGKEFKIPLLIEAPKVMGESFIVANIKDVKSSSFKNKSILEFMVHEPEVSKKLGKAMIFVPEWEHGLEHMVEEWGLKAPSISWGQVMLCAGNTWKRLKDNDDETIKMIERALKRKMSVVFIDFGPLDLSGNSNIELLLPFDIHVEFTEAASPEREFSLISDKRELRFNLYGKNSFSWNGDDHVVVPAVDMKISSEKTPVNIVKTGANPFRFPVVKIPVGKGNGDIILCQLITGQRLERNSVGSNKPHERIEYDPLAVQFVMNLVSMSVDEKLLK